MVNCNSVSPRCRVNADGKAGHQQDLYYKYLCHWDGLRIGLMASFSFERKNVWEPSKPKCQKSLCIHAFYTNNTGYQKFYFKKIVQLLHWSNHTEIMWYLMITFEWKSLPVHAFFIVDYSFLLPFESIPSMYWSQTCFLSIQ